MQPYNLKKTLHILHIQLAPCALRQCWRVRAEGSLNNQKLRPSFLWGWWWRKRHKPRFCISNVWPSNIWKHKTRHNRWKNIFVRYCVLHMWRHWAYSLLMAYIHAVACLYYKPSANKSHLLHGNCWWKRKHLLVLCNLQNKRSSNATVISHHVKASKRRILNFTRSNKAGEVDTNPHLCVCFHYRIILCSFPHQNKDIYTFVSYSSHHSCDL